MRNNSLFFTEFMITGNDGKETYYLPVLFDTGDKAIADSIRSQIVEILKDEFKEVDYLSLKGFNEGLQSEMLEEITKKNNKAEIIKINLKSLHLYSLGEETIQLNKEMKIVPQNLQLILKHNIYYHLDQSSILTTKINSESDIDKDFTALKIL